MTESEEQPVADDLNQPEAADTGEETTAGPGTQDDLQAQLTAAEDRAARAADEVLRIRAEMDNFRRRSQREIDNARKFALERFMGDLLDVRDSLERGLEAATNDQVSIEQLKEGKEMTFRMLDKAMTAHGLVAIDPVGEPFNPEHHEAISMVPSPDHAPDAVVAVVQKGYLLNDRLIRPARVVVAQPKT